MSIAWRPTPLAFILFFLTVVPAQATEPNFIQIYVDAHGGCRGPAPLLTFEQGARAAASPFGKAADEWSDDDVRALQATMTRCIGKPNGFDLGEERQILRRVTSSVEEGRQNRINQEQQAAAQRDMNQRRAEEAAKRAHDRLEHQEQQAAVTELQILQRHVMSDVELDRARQLKARFPKLTTWIDNLLRGQEAMRQDEAEHARLVKERDEAERRAQAEQARQALIEQRAAQEAEVEAARKRDAFAKSIPASCKEAQALDEKLEHGPEYDAFVRASALAEAGDTKGACASFQSYVTKLEATRSALIQCTKDLDQNLDELARTEAQRSLSRATEIYAQQKFLRQKMTDLSCS